MTVSARVRTPKTAWYATEEGFQPQDCENAPIGERRGVKWIPDPYPAVAHSNHASMAGGTAELRRVSHRPTQPETVDWRSRRRASDVRQGVGAHAAADRSLMQARPSTGRPSIPPEPLLRALLLQMLSGRHHIYGKTATVCSRATSPARSSTRESPRHRRARRGDHHARRIAAEPGRRLEVAGRKSPARSISSRIPRAGSCRLCSL